jgi:hypothetical protein
VGHHDDGNEASDSEAETRRSDGDEEAGPAGALREGVFGRLEDPRGRRVGQEQGRSREGGEGGRVKKELAIEHKREKDGDGRSVYWWRATKAAN